MNTSNSDWLIVIILVGSVAFLMFSGYQVGEEKGWNEGRKIGYTEGYERGTLDGENKGFIEGIEAVEALFLCKDWTRIGKYNKRELSIWRPCNRGEILSHDVGSKPPEPKETQ